NGRVTAKSASMFKFGLKFRDKEKTRTRDEFTLTSSTTIPWATAQIDDAGSHQILDGRYTIGPYMSLSTAADLPGRFALTSVENHARDTEDFVVGERVTSGYGMAEFYAGSRLYVLAGVRYEHTAADFTGNDVSFSPSGAWVATTPITGAHNYGTV